MTLSAIRKDVGTTICRSSAARKPLAGIARTILFDNRLITALNLAKDADHPRRPFGVEPSAAPFERAAPSYSIKDINQLEKEPGSRVCQPIVYKCSVRSIPARGEAPGNGSNEKPRAEGPFYRAGLQPLSLSATPNLGRWRRLV